MSRISNQSWETLSHLMRLLDLAVLGNLRIRLAYLVGSLVLLILSSGFLVELMLKNGKLLQCHWTYLALKWTLGII